MSITSVPFLLMFFPIAMACYYVAPNRFKNTVLVAASLFFYVSLSHEFALHILLFIVVNYLIGLGISVLKKARLKKALLITGLAFNLGSLVYYKYMNFFLEEINKATGAGLLSIAVPLGLSFLTFEGVSFLVDIYRGDAEVGSFIGAALFFSFFPKLVSGPIVRYCDFAPQIKLREHSLERLNGGIEKIVIGCAQKILIADALGVVVDKIYAGMNSGIDAPTAWLCALLYMLQIYFDFAGYSNCAIGLADFCGFNIKANFDMPYISCSVTEFWRRWHISLGQWFKYYLYIPLGGNRKGNVYVNLFCVFLATGIWHGANWTFFLWGLANGVAMILERVLFHTKLYQKIGKVFKWLITTVFVYFCWILFRAADISSAWHFLKTMFMIDRAPNVPFTVEYFLNPFIIAVLIIAILFSTYPGKLFYEKIWNAPVCSGKALTIVKMAILAVLFIFTIMTMMSTSYSTALYANF